MLCGRPHWEAALGGRIREAALGGQSGRSKWEAEVGGRGARPQCEAKCVRPWEAEVGGRNGGRSGRPIWEAVGGRDEAELGGHGRPI